MPKFQKLLEQQPQNKPVISLNHCLKNLQEIRDFYQTHGAEENVFNSIGNLEKVSLALSLQAKNSHQSRLTDYFRPKYRYLVI